MFRNEFYRLSTTLGRLFDLMEATANAQETNWDEARSWLLGDLQRQFDAIAAVYEARGYQVYPDYPDGEIPF